MELDIRDIMKQLRAQGWRIEERTKSWFFIPPEPTRPIVSWAKTPSDRRAIRNLIARLKRSGFREE